MPYYFVLPIDLTPDQQLAVDETEPIALSGGPGTGKTVVSLWRHIYNYDRGRTKSLLLTYTKTLEFYLMQSARTKNKEAANNVSRTYKWTYSGNKYHYNEIIVDEAQDVEINRYNVIQEYSNQCSYGADDAQSLYCPRCSSLKQLRNKFPNNEEYTLDINFRNSREILLFIQSVFPTVFIPQRTIDNAKETRIKPIVQIINQNEDETISKIVEIVNGYSSDTHNIGILLPTVNQVNRHYKLLKDTINCTKFVAEDETFTEMGNIHLATFKSAKGIEFDTVIIPNFGSYQRIIANPDLPIEMNDYYVALTRAKKNLFLFCRFRLRIDNTTHETEQ